MPVPTTVVPASDHGAGGVIGDAAGQEDRDDGEDRGGDRNLIEARHDLISFAAIP